MKKIRLLILPIITIVLEILPYGAVLVFAPSPTDSSEVEAENVTEKLSCGGHKVTIRTFGYFDVFVDGRPILWSLLINHRKTISPLRLSGEKTRDS